eukprot:980455-Rhodomonas_salina.1
MFEIRPSSTGGGGRSVPQGNNASPVLRHAIQSYAQSKLLDSRGGTICPTVPGQAPGPEAACGPQLEGCNEHERPAQDKCWEAHPLTTAGRERETQTACTGQKGLHSNDEQCVPSGAGGRAELQRSTGMFWNLSAVQEGY